MIVFFNHSICYIFGIKIVSKYFVKHSVFFTKLLILYIHACNSKGVHSMKLNNQLIALVNIFCTFKITHFDKLIMYILFSLKFEL